MEAFLPQICKINTSNSRSIMYESIANPNSNRREFSLNRRIFSLPNGIIDHDDDDIEMIAVRGINYTSLKDLTPESPPSPSWREIPIKDPLLQHAAWAYLQPMMAERRIGDVDRRWWRRLHDKVCWLLSCFNGVVLVVFEGWFPEKVRERLMIKI